MSRRSQFSNLCAAHRSNRPFAYCFDKATYRSAVRHAVAHMSPATCSLSHSTVERLKHRQLVSVFGNALLDDGAHRGARGLASATHFQDQTYLCQREPESLRLADKDETFEILGTESAVRVADIAFRPQQPDARVIAHNVRRNPHAVGEFLHAHGVAMAPCYFFGAASLGFGAIIPC